MRRAVAAALLALAIATGATPAVAQQTDQLCVSIFGEPPEGGWTASTLRDALNEGDVLLTAVMAPALCTGEVIAAPTPTPETGPLTTFDDGFWVVGEDIRPGTYRAEVAGGCYWARYSDFNDNVIDNGLAESPRRYEVRIRAGDAAFESDSCGTWTRVGR